MPIKYSRKYLYWNIFLILVILWLLSACGERETFSDKDSRVTDSVNSIRIYPSNLHLSVGQTYELSAILGDSAQNTMPVRKNTSTMMNGVKKQALHVIGDDNGRTGRIVYWHSSRPDIVDINANGLLSALSRGAAIITATSEGRSESTTVNVLKSDDLLSSVIPISATLSIGDTIQLTTKLKTNNETPLVTPITWSPDDPSKVRISKDGLVTAIASGTVKITAKSNNKLGQSVLKIIPAKKIFGLDFPGNAGVNKTMHFVLASPPPAFPATYIWRAYPRQQQSYYTAFFWGNNGPFYGKKTYYGFHPYPDWNTTQQHYWEIASPPGGDFVSRHHVVYDRWYIQVAICTQIGNKTKEEYYWDWPNYKRVIRHIGKKYSAPPNPALIIGDAPWNQGNEVWDGVIRGFQFYNTSLTLEEIAQEIASPGKIRTPWYMNLDPTPEDISDKSVEKNNPSWVGPERPSLWSGEIIEGKVIRAINSNLHRN